MNVEESMHSGRSHEKYTKKLEPKLPADYPHIGPTILGGQPRHLANPLRYGRPFDIKINKHIENEWMPHMAKDSKPSRLPKSRPRIQIDREPQSKDNSIIYRSDEEGPTRLKTAKNMKKRILPADNSGKGW